jgi:acetolactate synthase-1/2/3 large subunit
MEPRAGHWTDEPADDVGDAIVAALAAGGVDHVFFTSGSDIAFLQEATAKRDALGRSPTLRLVTVPHEHVGLNAALGYAAVTGRPAMTAVHVDAGTLNQGGAIHTAWRSGLPVLITAGSPPTAYAGSVPGARDEGGHLWLQESFDQHAIVRGYTKWDRRLTGQDDPGLVVSRAIQVALSEPAGPVYLSLPKELVLQPRDGAHFPSASQLGIPRPAGLDPGVADELAERLIGATSPVVVVSRSGRDPGTVGRLVELAESLGLAVVDAAHRAYLCFPMRHPLKQSPAVLRDADVVLVLDADVPWIPGRDAPPPEAFVAVVGYDPVHGRIPTYEFTADVRAVASPASALASIAAAAASRLTGADRIRITARRARLEAASAARIAALEHEAEAASAAVPMSPLLVSHQIGRMIDERSLVLDETLRGPRTADFLTSAAAGSNFANPGSSGGWAVGAAIGAKLAAPEQDVIALAGDGFYMFGSPTVALWTAARHEAPFLMVVYTNRSYTTGTTRVGNAYGRDGYAARAGYPGGYFDPPIDFAREAEAAGAYGETVRDPAEVGPALRRGLAATRDGRCAVISMWLARLEAGD